MKEKTEKEASVTRNLPWVEKYRPTQLDELISHQDIIKTLERFMTEGRLPHLLFYGPPGTGKTTTILACARKLYTPAQFASMVLELNASDERGIEMVRSRVVTFATTRVLCAEPVAVGTLPKLVILDEADAMTNDAQSALRRVIEAYTNNVRFCLICNYLSKIIPAIQSRCTRFRFAPLDKSLIMPRLRYVVQQENVNATEDGLAAIVNLCEGDMRRVLNVLQSSYMSCDVVDETAVYSCVGHPLKTDMQSVLRSLLNDTFQDAYTVDIASHLHIDLVRRLAAIECRLCAGANEKPQAAALVAAFRFTRHKLHQEAVKKSEAGDGE